MGAQADAGGDAGGSGIDGGGVDGASRDGRGTGADADATAGMLPDAGAEGGDGSALGDAAEDGSDEGGCPASPPVGYWPMTGPCDTNHLVCHYTSALCVCLSNDCAGGCCPASCEQLGFPCGVVGDGCGGELLCRVCPAGQACGAHGACVPSDDAGATPDGGVCVPAAGCPTPACGIIDDGCGGQIDCGECFWNCQPPMM